MFFYCELVKSVQIVLLLLSGSMKRCELSATSMRNLPHQCPSSSLLLLSILFLFSTSISIDLITPSQPLRDGETIVSPLGVFELGFFTPAGSTNRYVGIWYKHIPGQTTVWVANRNAPLTGSGGRLMLDATGNLIITNTTGFPIWSSNTSTAASNPIAQLLDSGNFVVQDGNEEEDSGSSSIAWQSFDHPTDTWLVGMKLSSKNPLGLTSWKNGGDASVGDHSMTVVPRGLYEVVIRRGSVLRFRSGWWNGLSLTGIPQMIKNQAYSYSYFSDDKEAYYLHEPINERFEISRFVLDTSGLLQDLHWVNETQSWEVFKTVPKDQCDIYRRCGSYAACNPDRQHICECLQGFEPRYPKEWSMRDWYRGCVRKTELDFGEGDGFRKFEGMKLPDTLRASVDRSLSLEKCRRECLKNRSCSAFASENANGEGVGCVMWADDLMDIKELSYGGQDLYVRLAALELGESHNGQTNDALSKKTLTRIISTAVSLGFISCCICVLFFLWRRRLQVIVKTQDGEISSLLQLGAGATNGENSTEFSTFKYASLIAATNNFSDANKIGEGGFGPVYKGVLCNGQEVAVKRLSNSSKQGQQEFITEATLIARLQHMNLVRLIGICIQREERMLIYEYLPNRSLDSILFDRIKGAMLHWPLRKSIMEGIAQGLLYLHKYSRLKIIHRDLKASNILLDADWNPKISDFGLARIFSGNNNIEKTRRIVGTYGYMPPEYACLGIFSEKSDVFSYGVLLLEIVSGKKNVGFHRVDGPLNLLEYAWDLWRNGSALELVDANLYGLFAIEEAFRCIKVGLLCVQESPEDRPTMAATVSMLNCEEAGIPSPKRPAFCIRSQVKLELDMRGTKFGSSNCVSDSSLEAR